MLNNEELNTPDKKHAQYDIIEKDPALKEINETAEKERIDTWKERLAKVQPRFSYKSVIKENGINIEAKFNDQSIKQSQQAETQRAAMCAATGTASEDFGKLIFEQTLSGVFQGNSPDSTFNAVHSALLAMSPADEYEGMLCSRLLVLHNQYMKFMARSAMPNQNDEGIDLNITRATKLMRLYNETMEALNRHRRKGEQKVTVQHVNVNSGGQAVVTSQFTQGEGNTKN